MRLLLLHARSHAKDAMRTPSYWVPALFFPLLFFALFGLIRARALAESGVGSEYVITPFLLFTTLNVTLATLSAGIASDRESPWEGRLRLLPVSGLVRFAGRVTYVLAFNLASWIPLLLFATITTSLRLPVYLWPVWLGAVLLGAIPFALLGMAMGYLLAGRAAMMAANFGFLVFAFLGGLFVPVEFLPAAVQSVAPFVPSHEWLHLVLAAIGRADEHAPPLWTVGLLVVWTGLFGVLAHWAFRRDEGVRYG